MRKVIFGIVVSCLLATTSFGQANNATLTGTAKNILTALGLNQTSMSAVFGPNPTVVWE